jgi:hypothetical protein
VKTIRRTERNDPITGEILSTVETTVIGTPMKYRDKDFLKVFPAFFASFLRELQIDDGKPRLILYLMYKAHELKSDSDNVIYAPNKELMEHLAISKPTLIRYINDLIRINFIERLGPRVPAYRINPEMVYKGTLHKYQEKYISNVMG